MGIDKKYERHEKISAPSMRRVRMVKRAPPSLRKMD
jgi:hypothetical protein